MSNKKPIESLTCCDASRQMLKIAAEKGIETVFDRAADMRPCPIGAAGICCKNCAMGPCRVASAKKDGEPAKVGLCGATQETIAARNFARMVAAGSAAHSDHGRGVAEVFLLAAQGKIPGYGIKDEQKLMQLGLDFDLDVANLSLRGTGRSGRRKMRGNVRAAGRRTGIPETRAAQAPGTVAQVQAGPARHRPRSG